ncbi:TVP38/TMEM64 family protein [Desulfosediminicola ganghwensis]|uniref:TVP38/TMEM64 family protein n=1 Tax=Desulfosediminicola ganghwensis TaxID=2569540 RepID=UPI0010AD45D7|nr:TVP38/TMEM64 family protein [Desulfosediminicola ganghwensis]
MVKNKKFSQAVFLGFLALMGILFFGFDLHHLLTFERLKASQAEFAAMFSDEPVKVIVAYFAVYIPYVVLNLPGVIILGLAAGAMFGAGLGTLIVSFASTIGAALACIISRYLLRDWVQARFGSKLDSVHRGIAEEGHFYLFSLRLIPVIPFFVINMVMGVTHMPLRTFVWVSMLGMLPGTFVFVNAGSQLAKLDSGTGILSPGLLLSFALLGSFPLAVKRMLCDYKRRRRWKDE